jgi:hypothetical protein
VSGTVSDAVSGAVHGTVRDAVGVAVSGAVSDAVSGAVHGTVRDAVGVAVHDAVSGAVRDAVDDAVDGAVRDAVDGAVHDAVGGPWWRYIGGRWWAAWPAYVGFFRDVCGLDLAPGVLARHAAYEGAQLAAGWWWPHQSFVIVSDVQGFLRRDDRGRLHSPTGQAIGYADGWGLWFWHGLQVPQDIIEQPQAITVERVRGQANAEIRRVMIERMTPGRYLLESGAKVIDMDARPVEGGAPRALLADSFGDRWLVGSDGSTDRVYHMPVPQDVKTCREAHERIACVTDESMIRLEA